MSNKIALVSLDFGDRARIAQPCLLRGFLNCLLAGEVAGAIGFHNPTETLVAPNGPVPETGFEPLSMRSIEPL
jgi:hypothetical protein